jgi:glycerol kinase
METDSGVPLRELRVDGGAARNNLLMQIQADLLGVPVTRPSNPETTVLGATYLAGLAVGFWRDQNEISRYWTADARFEPHTTAEDRHARRAGWARALERSRSWETP